jgi:hypothetical protein
MGKAKPIPKIVGDPLNKNDQSKQIADDFWISKRKACLETCQPTPAPFRQSLSLVQQMTPSASPKKAAL